MGGWLCRHPPAGREFDVVDFEFSDAELARIDVLPTGDTVNLDERDFESFGIEDSQARPAGRSYTA